MPGLWRRHHAGTFAVDDGALPEAELRQPRRSCHSAGPDARLRRSPRTMRPPIKPVGVAAIAAERFQPDSEVVINDSFFRGSCVGGLVRMAASTCKHDR